VVDQEPGVDREGRPNAELETAADRRLVLGASLILGYRGGIQIYVL
jgi:hypothetical protein